MFSLTQQSIQLGFLPRLSILHTAADQEGQIYLPLANWLLAAATLAAVLIFRSSDALAGAYGIAVSGLMAISTFLAALIALKWGYNPLIVIAVNGAFLLLDLVFFASNAVKLLEGGWFPLVIAGLIAFLMLTWRGGALLMERIREDQREEEDAFLARLGRVVESRTDGTGAFLTVATTGIPLSLTYHVRHNRSLQKRVVLLSVMTVEKPHVPDDRRAEVTTVGEGMDRIILRFGFMEGLNVPAGLAAAGVFTPEELDEVSYYIGRETVIADAGIKGMAPWREQLFVSMQRNTSPTGSSFCIPSAQVVEIGTEVRI